MMVLFKKTGICLCREQFIFILEDCRILAVKDLGDPYLNGRYCVAEFKTWQEAQKALLVISSATGDSLTI